MMGLRSATGGTRGQNACLVGIPEQRGEPSISFGAWMETIRRDVLRMVHELLPALVEIDYHAAVSLHDGLDRGVPGHDLLGDEHGVERMVDGKERHVRQVADQNPGAGAVEASEKSVQVATVLV